jgi:hypothetical protein
MTRKAEPKPKLTEKAFKKIVPPKRKAATKAR